MYYVIARCVLRNFFSTITFEITQQHNKAYLFKKIYHRIVIELLLKC